MGPRAETQKSHRVSPRHCVCLRELRETLFEVGIKRFIADLVAAGLLVARTDAVDEWLQVALALSIEIFWESPLSPSAIAEGSAVSTDRSGDDEASPVAVHILRIDDWMTILRSTTKAGETQERQGGLDSPR